MAKRGPKPKIGPEEKAKVIAAVKVCGSIADAAGTIEVGVQTLYAALRNDPKFRRGVVKARKDAKLRLIKKIKVAKPWQAAAWMLERMYGKEWGRKERHEVSGPNGAPLKTDVNHSFSYDQFAREIDDVRREREAAAGRLLPPDRN